MAAGPADAFSATPRGFSCYDRELITAAADNLWSSSVVATASTGASWVDEVHNSDPVEKRIEEIKRRFHRGRVLQIKHLPREVTEEEVRELLGEWDVQSVTIQSGAARVSLCAPEVLEDWDRNAVFTVRGQRVTIVPSPTEMLLCVGRLPLSYSEAQFTSLVSIHGEIRRSFLMISERTESKGYGFVEYVTKEAALQAKNALDGKRILDFTAVCDWLDSSHVTIRSLHSKCLYVDRLPPNYRDMGEFRRVFSTIVNPPYCQIALRNGCPQDWGLVEFINEDDAEKTQVSLDGYVLHGHRIRVAYYIPGVRAINLYLKLLNDGGTNKGKSALLPDPPAPAVFQQLQSLAKQNPVFAQNLQTIIMQQIQDLQKGKGGAQDPNKRPQYQKGPMAPSPFGSPQGNSPGGGNPNLVKNAQHTALTLLLASQMQQQQQQQQQNGMGGGGGGSGQMSPNNSSNSQQALQNQQLLAALHAMSKGGNGGGNGVGNGDQFLNGIPSLNTGSNNGPNLTNLLGLASPNNGISLSPQQMDQPPNGIPHGYYPSHGVMLSPGGNSQASNGSNNGSMKDDQWAAFKSANRNTPSFGSNGLHKTPLLPSPSGLSSPSLDVPMDTGMNTPKTPPGDPLQAVWYSLFGQSSSPDSSSNSPGNTSPLFMKSPMSSSNGSPIGRSADALFGLNHYLNNKSSPPGFATPNGHHPSHMHQNRGGMNGDLQEALNTLLSNPQNLSHIFGGNNQGLMGGGNDAMSPPQFGNHHNMSNGHGMQHQQHMAQQMSHLQRPNSLAGGLEQGGVSNALIDLLMHSMKGDQPQHDNFGGPKHNSWSSGVSNPPSPIGNNRPFHNGQQQQQQGGMGQPQRNGSNGSSEMSSSSPRSPTYSPFSRNSSKGLLESGNGNASPTPTWSNAVLGSPPHSGGYIGGPHSQHHQQPHQQLHVNSFTSQSRNIWAAPSVSPGATSLNNNNLMNPLGIKRKVNHETCAEVEGFLPGAPHAPPSHGVNGSNNGGNHHQSHNHHSGHHGGNDSLASHYADSYFKKKKKN